MEFGICLLSVIPLRKEPSDMAEMVSQLLFGEMVVVLKIDKNWLFIRNVQDSYEGWVDYKQIEPLEESRFNELSHQPQFFIRDLVEVITRTDTDEMIPVTLGAIFRNLNKGTFRINNKTFFCSAELKRADIRPSYINLKENALVLQNAPYLWGGKSPFGIDCSGFVQLVYSLSGINLMRDTSLQVGSGEPISFIEEARPGDLMFFDNEEGQIVHVGMLLEDNKIIHASGKVRIDSIDHQGIFNNDLRRYSHKLRLIRRVL